MPSTHDLAVWGALTGTVGSASGLIALLNLARERPKVRLTMIVVYKGSSDNAELVFTAVNEGRRAITLVDGGVATGNIIVGRWPRRVRFANAYFAAPPDGLLPKRLDPWEPVSWTYRLGSEPKPESYEDAFVRDSSGHYHWGTAAR